MAPKTTVSAYIAKHGKWAGILRPVREIILRSELEETVKWGAPAYTLNGKIVLGLAAFKNHCAIWFHQGVFLKDLEKKLKNDGTVTAKAMRQWQFVLGDTVPKKTVAAYVREAIANTLVGKELKPVPKQAIALPPLLQNALKNDTALKNAFKALSPSKRREYKEYIAEAKQQATKLRRLEKIKP
ncbi:MAG: DUF1801 domain-containing protein, partial [Marinirhabdus sp.]